MSFKNTVLITGGTQNLGYFAALSIARKHPEYLVIIASRTDPTSAATKINTALSQKNVLYLPLDLSSTPSVRAFASTYASKSYPPLIALLLNAGLQFPGEVQKTSEGIESTFAINHLGHALLFHLLFPFFAPNIRVVVTVSGTHDPAQKTGLPDAIYTSAELLAHPSPETSKYIGRQRYASSKLANVLWSYALSRRFEKLGNGMSVVSFDPGLMPGTGLLRDASSIEKFLWNKVLPYCLPLMRMLINNNIHSPQTSGEALARAAMDEKTTGVYYEGRKLIDSSKDSYDVGKQEDLWKWTVGYLAKNEEERKAFDIGK